MFLLDLFCGAGGAAMGYARAGFEVVGVDIRPQPHYPFEFIQADALEFCVEHGHEFDVIHASPPCQAYSRLEHVVRARLGDAAPPRVDLIAATRQTLRATGRPYVIENVPGAPLVEPFMLCGLMFGLRVVRHRLFESNVFVMTPPHPPHHGVFTNASRGVSGFRHGATHICITGNNFVVADACAAMDIDWMTARELAQAIPPAYTEYVGRFMLPSGDKLGADVSRPVNGEKL